MRGDFLSEDVGSSLELLYDRTYDDARRVAAKVIGEAGAEDVAMEAMVRAGQMLEDGVPLEEVGELVTVIAYGLAVDEYRRGESPAGLGMDDQLGALLDARAVSDFEAAEFDVLFDSGVRALEDEQRDAFILTDLRGLTVREAAGVLRTSYPTVHRRAEVARTLLREELAA